MDTPLVSNPYRINPRRSRHLKTAEHKVGRQDFVFAGAQAGVCGGFALMFVLMVYSYGVGEGFWLPLKSIAGFILGVDALVGTGGAIFLGFCIHVVASACFGAIFALLVPKDSSSGPLFLEGIIYGLVVWAVMTFVVLPLVNSTLSDRVATMATAWFFAHLLFGGFLALIPGLEHRHLHLRAHA